MVSEILSTEIREAIKSVNESMKTYEADWVSLKRSPESEKERITSIRQFIECRLNMEFYFLQSLQGIVEYFDGHLLEVTGVIGADEKRRRFEYVTFRLNRNPEYYQGQEDFNKVLDKLETLIGGNTIQFTYSSKRPKITIWKL